MKPRTLTLAGSGAGSFCQYDNFVWQDKLVRLDQLLPMPTSSSLAQTENFPVAKGRYVSVWSLGGVGAFDWTGLDAKNIATTGGGTHISQFLVNNYLVMPSDLSSNSSVSDGTGGGIRVQHGTGGLTERRECLFLVLVNGNQENTNASRPFYYDAGWNQRTNAIAAMTAGAVACLPDYVRFALHTWYINYTPFTVFGPGPGQDSGALDIVQKAILADYVAAIGGTDHGVAADVATVTGQWQAILDAFYPT